MDVPSGRGGGISWEHHGASVRLNLSAKPSIGRIDLALRHSGQVDAVRTTEGCDGVAIRVRETRFWSSPSRIDLNISPIL